MWPFNNTCNDSTKDNGFKLKKGIFRLDLRMNFFTMRLVGKVWFKRFKEKKMYLTIFLCLGIGWKDSNYAFSSILHLKVFMMS